MAPLTVEEENYIRMSFLLTGISRRAVRCLFDRHKDLGPAALEATILRENIKLKALQGRKLINQVQWNLLHPGSGIPDSNNFDVTLMICLLRNLTTITPPLSGFDRLPPFGETTEGADLARIKYYRNSLAHINDAKIDIPKFTTAWNDVAHAVGRLGGQSMVQECQELGVKILDQSNKDVIPWNVREQINRKLETWKNDNKMFFETRASKRLLECVKKTRCVTVTGSSGMGKTFTVRYVALQMAGIGYDILPVNSPKDIQKYYNPNKKALFVIDDFCGIYTLNQNALDKWKSLSDTITNILDDEVTRIVASCRSQVYQDDSFQSLPLFTSCECNLMSETFCLLNRERQSLAELYLKGDASKIRKYANLYDCFPLLCKLYSENPQFDVTIFFMNPFSVYEAEVSSLWIEKAYGKYCALALCVMFNNHLKEEWLTEDISKDMRTVIENTYEACKLERGTSRLVIRDELESLSNTFIRKYMTDSRMVEIEDNDANSDEERNSDVQNQSHFYCSIHDKLFDYLVSYFGKVMITTLIKNGDSELISERFQFERQYDGDQFIIILPEKFEQMYLQRMIDDWSKGHVSNIFNNMNMKRQKFRDIFLKFWSNLEPCFQKQLAKMSDVTYTTRDESYERYEWENFSSTTPLIHCCLVGDINMVKWFCDNGSNVNWCNVVGESPLYIACLKGHFGIVATLLEHGANINQCRYDSESPLYIACAGGYTEVVTLLISNSADVNNRTNLGESPLYVACAGGYTEIVTILVDKNADVNNPTKWGESTLYVACAGGHTEVVTKLLDNKAHVNQCTDKGESPLYKACAGGYTEVVTKLLVKKANVNQCTKKERESPLYVASAGGYTDVVTELIRHQADVNQCTQQGISPLYKACKEGYTEVVFKLVDNYADVNHLGTGESPLYIACQGGLTEIVTKLLDNKSHVNQCTSWGESPLYVACTGGYTEIVTKLLDKKADVNQCTEMGKPPLYKACAGGYTDVIILLLQNEANANQSTDESETPLFAACKVWCDLLNSSDRHIYLNKYDIFTKLEVNSENKERYSNTVKLLINAGADYTLCNKDGKSPLGLFNNQRIIDMIKSWKEDKNPQ